MRGVSVWILSVNLFLKQMFHLRGQSSQKKLPQLGQSRRLRDSWLHCSDFSLSLSLRIKKKPKWLQVFGTLVFKLCGNSSAAKAKSFVAKRVVKCLLEGKTVCFVVVVVVFSYNKIFTNSKQLLGGTMFDWVYILFVLIFAEIQLNAAFHWCYTCPLFCICFFKFSVFTY